MDSDGRYQSMVLASFWFQVDCVLAGEVPEVLQVLAQIVGPEKLIDAIGAGERTKG